MISEDKVKTTSYYDTFNAEILAQGKDLTEIKLNDLQIES